MNEMQKERFAEALKRLSGDEDTLELLSSMVAEDAPVLMESMRKQLAENDLRSYAKSAHALKGLLSSFETGHPVDEIQSTIDAAREGDINGTRQMHENVGKSLQIFVDDVAAISRP